MCGCKIEYKTQASLITHLLHLSTFSNFVTSSNILAPTIGLRFYDTSIEFDASHFLGHIDNLD